MRMMRALYYIPVIFFAGLITSCGPAAQQTETRHDPFTTLVKKIEKKPSDIALSAQLKETYHALTREQTDKIQLLRSGDSDISSLIKIADAYKELERINNIIRQSPPAADIIKPESYLDSISQYNITIADAFYRRGQLLLSSGEKNGCREASKLFKAALQYQPGSARIKEKLEETMNNCSYTVLIVPEENNTFSYYSSDINNFLSRLSAGISTLPAGPYVVFSMQGENKQAEKNAAEILRLKFINIDIGTLNTEKNSRDVSMALPEQTGRRGVTASATTGTGTFTNTITRMISRAKIQLDIYSTDGSIVYTETIGSEHEWSNETASFTGNTRVLNAEERAQLRKTQKQPPAKQEIAEELMQQLLQRTLNWLQDRYKDY